VTVPSIRHNSVVVSMARRKGLESANSALKGAAFVSLSRGFFRVIGGSRNCPARFTLAAYNPGPRRSFKAKHGLTMTLRVVERPKQHRARRRSGTWAELTKSGPAPPPT